MHPHTATSPLAGLIGAAVVSAVISAVIVVLFKLARRGRRPAQVVVAAPARGAAAPRVVLAVLVVLGVGAFYGRGVKAAGRPAQAAPRSAPSSKPVTVIHEVTRYVPVHDFPVSGWQIVLIAFGCLAAAVVVTRVAGRYFGS